MPIMEALDWKRIGGGLTVAFSLPSSTVSIHAPLPKPQSRSQGSSISCIGMLGSIARPRSSLNIPSTESKFLSSGCKHPTPINQQPT